jgi:predicted transglutaminase-like cysteine proteinase
VSNRVKHSGILSGFKVRLQKNRLGELLVHDGFLSPQELKKALHDSKREGLPLGKFLVLNDLVEVDVIRQTLVEQFSLRVVTALMTIFLSFAGFGVKPAKAGTVKDVPSLMQIANQSFAPVSGYPELFGSEEKRSTNLKAFTKWSGMFDRFEMQFQRSSDAEVIEDFKDRLDGLKALPLPKMAAAVNDMLNEKRYILDSSNYGQTDYWATPVEFMRRGGDCEDYAIAKYTALRALGVPENRLRLLILQDMKKNIPHAILVVYTDQGPLLLDNQIKTAIRADKVSHYKPIFSINREAWWLHSKPQATVTVVASSAGR